MRSSWLTLDRKALFVRSTRPRPRPGPPGPPRSRRRGLPSARRPARSRAAFWHLDLGVQPRVLDGGRDQAADRVQQRPVAGRARRDRTARLSTARTPTVRPLADQRRPEERGDLEQPGERPVALVGILVDVAEEERPVGLVELDQVRARQVERQAQLGDRGGHLGAAADRPAVGQDVELGVGQQDQRAIEAEMAGDGLERAVEQLVAIERRAGRGGQLVEGHQLGEPRAGGPGWRASDALVGVPGSGLAASAGPRARRRAAPPYRTSPAGSSVASTIASES